MRHRAAGVAVVVGVSFILLMPPFAQGFDSTADQTVQVRLCAVTMLAYLVAAVVLAGGRTWWAWAMGAAGLLGLGTTLVFERGNHHPWELTHPGGYGPLHWLLSGATVLVAAVPPVRAWVGSAPRER